MRESKISDDEAVERLEQLDPADATVRDRSATDEISAALADRNEADLRLFRAVHRARDEGVTWVEIASALGVSHQAAMKRYGPQS